MATAEDAAVRGSCTVERAAPTARRVAEGSRGTRQAEHGAGSYTPQHGYAHPSDHCTCSYPTMLFGWVSTLEPWALEGASGIPGELAHIPILSATWTS